MRENRDSYDHPQFYEMCKQKIVSCNLRTVNKLCHVYFVQCTNKVCKRIVRLIWGNFFIIIAWLIQNSFQKHVCVNLKQGFIGGREIKLSLQGD